MNNSYTGYTVCFEGLVNINLVMVIINFRLLTGIVFNSVSRVIICSYQCEISDHKYACVEIKVVLAILCFEILPINDGRD